MFAAENLISDRPPFRSLALFLLTIVIGWLIVGPLIGTMITQSFYKGDMITDLERDQLSPELGNAMMVMQATISFFGLVLFPLIHITMIERKPLQPLFPAQRHLGALLIIVAAIGLTFPVAISPLTEWNLNMTFPDFMSGFEQWAKHEEEVLGKLTSLMTDIHTVGGLVTALLVIALLASVGEELVFRGIIQYELWRGSGNAHLAIWSSAFLFSAIHFQFYGFIPRLLLGVLFGYLYYWSGNLLIPIFSHFFNNAFGVIMVYLHNTEFTSIDVTDTAVATPLRFVIPCMIMTAALLYYTHRYYRRHSVLS